MFVLADPYNIVLLNIKYYDDKIIMQNDGLTH